MFEKDLSVAYLLDFYGEILSERKQQVMDEYYNNDLSLSEIGDSLGISRQAVREMIKRAEEELHFYESKLHLAQRFREAGTHAERLRLLASAHSLPDEVAKEIEALAKSIR